MNKFAILPLLFLGLHILQAQQGIKQAQQDIKLPGLVVEQNSQYRTGAIKYLPNTEIKSAGAAPQRSDDNGQFTLVFADRPGGDVVRIFAAKSGYEIVNEEVLKEASVIGRLKPLKIVMCKQGRLYDNQLALYNIAKDAVIASYERKVATLQKHGKERERLLAELRIQFNQDIKTLEEAMALLDQQRQLAEKQAKELADKWVTVNLDDESPAYQRAFAAFEAKNIELAKAVLDSVDLEKRLAVNRTAKAKEQALVDTLQKNIAKRAEEIRQDVNMCLFKARLHKLDYEWATAERYYDLAIANDSSNFEVVFEVAHYMQRQNQFAKARIYYEKALRLTIQPFEKSMILNNLGILLKANNEMGAAQQAYEESLQLRRKLAEKNPDVYLPYVATSLNNLGILLKSNNEMGAAQQAYEASLQLYRKLAEKNPDVYLPYVATSLNNLGNLLSANNEMGAAQQAYEESLQLYRKLAEKNPDVYLPEVANTLNNLGNLLSDNNEMGAAQQAYEESLQLRRKLAEKNPDVYLPYVATSLNSLGILLSDNNEMVAAQQAYEESLQLRRKLAEKNPDVYLPDVAMTLNNLGNLLSDNNEMGAAQQAYEESLQLYMKLAEKNPRLYNLDVAMTAINIGLFYEQMVKSTGNMSLKAAGLELMRDAEQRVAIFPETHPQVQNYRLYIKRLTQFFNGL
ncbi:tetratricopeptide repeat protein [Ascidiimonas sp. W6]|uniref:tetratricopeptide repeat protein n=1 Tax=Ascidiimonas meishanensis TaxID=3128903 RepID=UPI0030EF36C3